MAKGSGKRKLFKRKGLLAQESRMLRLMVAVVLLVVCAALSFTQLGFVGIGPEDDYSSYAMVLLIPISLTALLLGALWGAAMGAAAGGMLYAHALFMPLDYYEFMYVSPFSSIVMLGLSGWIIGLLFAFTLRNNPRGIRCGIYIALSCAIVSWLYTTGFSLNVFGMVITDLLANISETTSQEEAQAITMTIATTMVMRMGDIGMQALVDMVLMTVFCCLAHFGTTRMQAQANDVGIRSLFASWLTVVVLLAFMITSGASFVAITYGEESEGSEKLQEEVNYLCAQINGQNERLDALLTFIASTGITEANLTDESYQALEKSVSTDSLLAGYSEEDDGIIVMAAVEDDFRSEDIADAVVYASDSVRFVQGHKLGEYLDKDALAAASRSLDKDKVVRTVYDEVNPATLTTDDLVNDSSIQSYVVYLYCKQQDYSIVLEMLPASKVYADRAATMGWTALMSFVLLLAVFLMVFQLLRRLVIDRIDKTNSVLGHITGGDLDARVEERNTREFASLSDGINTTVDALKGWIAEAETRMDAELATAKAIQESALPRTFPPFPDILKFDVYASMNAAREVGGDFYDFFLIGDSNSDAGKLGFVIADVSGKGVPAALFMMKAMTQIRDYLQSGMEVGEAIENANRQLCDGNDAGMFVTTWVGVLDYAVGHIEYVNAGHNPPLLWQKEGGWRWLTEKSGLPLGLFEGFPYEAYSLECGIGDQFLLYTDGVTEAMSADGELYGEDRLEKLVNANFVKHPRALTGAVRYDVARHAEGAEQSDDITILALEVGVPPEVTSTLMVPADDKLLPTVNDFIHTELDRRLCPLRVQHQLDIAVEELFVNVCHYAYPDATPENPGMVRISYTYSAEPPSVTVTIIDQGIPYDPLAKPDAVTPDNIMDVPIGGLGILMAKRSVNEMFYERADDSNILTMVKKW